MAKPFCVSHRALGFGETENSMAALMASGNYGAKAIEYDLHHTKDHKTIIYHDEVFKRLLKGSHCPVGKKVHELELSQIESDCTLENGEKIPTFDEALEAMSKFNTLQFVELKDTILEADFQTIKKYYGDKPEKLLIISFDREALKLVLKKREEDSFFNNIKVILLKKYGYLGNINELDGIDAKYIHKSKVKKLQDSGKLVGVYTKDSDKRLKKYLSKGVDFVTTNDTARCERQIEEMGTW